MRVLASRTTREKVLLAVLAVVLLVFAGYKYVWEPLKSGLATKNASIQNYMTIAEFANSHEPAVKNTRLSVSTQSLPVTAIQTAKAFSLNLRRVQPQGLGVRLSMDEVAFDQVILWLEDLHKNYQISARSIEINRRPQPGVVSANLYLERGL